MECTIGLTVRGALEMQLLLLLLLTAWSWLLPYYGKGGCCWRLPSFRLIIGFSKPTVLREAAAVDWKYVHTYSSDNH